MILLLLKKPGSTRRRASKKSSVPIGGGVAGNWGSWWSEVSSYMGLRLREGIPLACLGPVAQAQHVTQHPGQCEAAPAFCPSPLWTTKGAEQSSSLLPSNFSCWMMIPGWFTLVLSMPVETACEEAPPPVRGWLRRGSSSCPSATPRPSPVPVHAGFSTLPQPPS